uniref:Uncharacterized protein n=1 Tax=Romanomermis culicivorax TaxID=13658 RepID=A0A915ISK7_ROMCU
MLSVMFEDDKSSLVSLDKSCEEVVKRPGSLIRVYQPLPSDQSSPSSCEAVSSPTYSIPYSSMAQAQLSFHGHKDAVKFIIAVRGCKVLTSTANVETKEQEVKTGEKRNYLILSGGDGYIDFRIGEDDSRAPLAPPKRDLSHLIIWKTEL